MADRACGTRSASQSKLVFEPEKLLASLLDHACCYVRGITEALPGTIEHHEAAAASRYLSPSMAASSLALGGLSHEFLEY
jgi:hypothetical protein